MFDPPDSCPNLSRTLLIVDGEPTPTRAARSARNVQGESHMTGTGSTGRA
jgi:hypothetical protein